MRDKREVSLGPSPRPARNCSGRTSNGDKSEYRESRDPAAAVSKVPLPFRVLNQIFKSNSKLILKWIGYETR